MTIREDEFSENILKEMHVQSGNNCRHHKRIGRLVNCPPEHMVLARGLRICAALCANFL